MCSGQHGSCLLNRNSLCFRLCIGFTDHIRFRLVIVLRNQLCLLALAVPAEREQPHQQRHRFFFFNHSGLQHLVVADLCRNFHGCFPCLIVCICFLAVIFNCNCLCFFRDIHGSGCFAGLHLRRNSIAGFRFCRQEINPAGVIHMHNIIISRSFHTRSFQGYVYFLSFIRLHRITVSVYKGDVNCLIVFSERVQSSRFCRSCVTND